MIHIGINVSSEDPDSGAPTSWRENEPIWYKKTSIWITTFRKACPLKTGMGGQFCAWRGGPCCYELCIPRIFEEVEMKEPSYFAGVPQSGLTATIQELRGQVLEQGRQIVHLQMRINQMKISGRSSLKARFQVQPSSTSR